VEVELLVLFSLLSSLSLSLVPCFSLSFFLPPRAPHFLFLFSFCCSLRPWTALNRLQQKNLLDHLAPPLLPSHDPEVFHPRKTSAQSGGTSKSLRTVVVSAHSVHPQPRCIQRIPQLPHFKTTSCLPILSSPVIFFSLPLMRPLPLLSMVNKRTSLTTPSSAGSSKISRPSTSLTPQLSESFLPC